MRRTHTFEFEDLPSLPGWLRDAITRLIVVFARVVGATDALACLVGRVCHQQQVEQVVDLGSGSGGVMPGVIERVRKSNDTKDVVLVMTDLFPNAAAVQTFGNDPANPVRYLDIPIDARKLEDAPAGLKVMANSFHHLRPESARSVLASAQDSGDPILIYELSDNKIPFLAWCAGLVVGLPLVFLFALVLTPWARPLSFRQLFFTYLVPIIPALYAWDGQASLPRIYGLKDLDELLDGLGTDSYAWEKGVARTDSGRAAGIYLLGTPSGPQ